MDFPRTSGAMRPLYKCRVSAWAALIMLLLACAFFPYGARLGDALRLKSSPNEEDADLGLQEAAALTSESAGAGEVSHNIQGETASPEAAQHDDTYPPLGSDEDVKIHFEIKTAGKIMAVSATMKGRRPTDEDALTTLEELNNNIYFMGLFDGHGGSETSKYLSENAHKAIGKALEAPGGSPVEVNEERIAEACIAIDKKLVMEGVCKDSGSTAVMLLVEHDILAENTVKLHSIYVGDSRIVVLNFDGAPIYLTEDHKPNLPEETARIHAAGGEVYKVHGIWRVGGSLAVSRAFGDPMFKNYASLPAWEQQVVALPGQRTKNVPVNSLLLLACDGLFETIDADLEEVFKAALEESAGNIVKAIRKVLLTAYDRGSGDNISVVAAMIHPVPAPPSSRRMTVGRDDPI